MFEESTRLQIIRLERLKDLQTRHRLELNEFDTLSRRPTPEQQQHQSNTPHQQLTNTRNNHPTLHSVSSNSSRESGAGSPRPHRAPFNAGRNSDRSLSGSSSRFPLPNRESSQSMTSLQSPSSRVDAGGGEVCGPGGGRIYNQSQSHSATNVGARTRNPDNPRNGNMPDRLSYHDGASRR